MKPTYDDHYLSAEEIKAWEPYKNIPNPGERNAALIQRIKDVGQWDSSQVAGRHWPIACVSLEITQRCNLDCSLCYLSENSEAVKDVPLDEVFRRIDMILKHYGEKTDIQISGGDPTLRKREELVKIVRRVHDLGMRPSLFTNGIKASRDLLKELADNGLIDVAFHVDLTQERKGYKTEVELNEIREKYIERAQGLNLNVFFNTTVFAGNFKEIPDLVRFFRKHAEQIHFASFQLQADTGRGVLRERDFIINQETVAAQIEKGAETEINFDLPKTGHPRCNKYGICLEANGNLYNFIENSTFTRELINCISKAKIEMERSEKIKTIKAIFNVIRKNPQLWGGTVSYLSRLLWKMKSDLFRSNGKANKISFFIHNFMDAKKLEADRCHSCVFMVASADGPISMCVHNAKRDDYLLKPLKVATEEGKKYWDPLTGQTSEEKVSRKEDINPLEHPLKHLKGNSKKFVLEQRMKKVLN